ncbi:MAG: NUDIX hydrolase [Anaerolineales bacterium]|nr:NUDIX hydrolase [Anaerolineales bacterium]
MSAVVVNDAKETLILENPALPHSPTTWQVIGRRLLHGENPIQAVQCELGAYLGHSEGYWVYLGSYESNQGVGHFFMAQDVPVTQVQPTDNHDPNWLARWVPVDDLRQALLDGRLSNLSFAANVALALFLFPPAIPG